jgi:hypothetical protein
MLLSRHQKSGQNHDITLENRRFENVAQFRYLKKQIFEWNSNSSVRASEESLRLTSRGYCDRR